MLLLLIACSNDEQSTHESANLNTEETGKTEDTQDTPSVQTTEVTCAGGETYTEYIALGTPPLLVHVQVWAHTPDWWRASRYGSDDPVWAFSNNGSIDDSGNMPIICEWTDFSDQDPAWVGFVPDKYTIYVE